MMTKKRNYISEVLEIKGRLFRRKATGDQLRQRLHPLVRGFRFLRDLDSKLDFRNELLKYIPIGYVACIEGYCRLLIKEIIDSGSPFLERIGEFDNIKIRLSDIPHILQKEVTIGEYIAHLIPLNNYDDINHAFSKILDQDFTNELKKVNYFFQEDGSKYFFAMPLFDDKNLCDLKTLFEIRHVYSHELAAKKKFGTLKIQRVVSAGASFTLTIDAFFEDLLQKKV